MADPRDLNLPPERLAILRDLTEALHGDKALIGEYLARFGWTTVTSANIRIIRREHIEEHGPAAPVSVVESPAEGGGEATGEHRSPWYEVNITCPICAHHFRTAQLRSKALRLVFRYKAELFPLMVPTADGAMKGFRTDDPLLRAAIVCPACLYAAMTLGSFITESSVSGTRGLMARLPERKIASLRKIVTEEKEKRIAIAPTLGAASVEDRSALLGIQRTIEIGREGLLLSAHLSMILADYEPIEYYRSGDALLGAARIAAEAEREAEEKEHLREAKARMEKSFELGSISALPAYLIGVISWHLGDLHGARAWIGRVLTDRGQLAGSIKYKRYCENLAESIKAARAAAGAGAEETPTA
jgi:hypothetical protein